MLKGLFGSESGEPSASPAAASDGGAAPGPGREAGAPPPNPGVYRKGVSGFDPEPLEAAVDLLNNIPRGMAGQARLQQLKGEELEHKEKLKKETAEMKEYVAKASQHVRHLENEEAKKVRQHRAEQDRKRAQYSDQLARERDSAISDYERLEREKAHKRDQESAARAEQLRRKTIEYEAELRQKTELETVKAETEGRILAERRNHDIRMEQLKQDRREMRDTVLDGIRLAAETVGKGASEFLSNKDEMVAAVATLSAVAFGVYAARTGTGVAGRFLEARLGRPSLVRDTSRRNVLDVVRSPWRTMRHYVRRLKGPGDALASDGDKPTAVFNLSMEDRLRRVATSTVNTKANKAPFRHMLLYGPPGTGKTLFAKGLAKASGMDYAILTGGDVAPLGREAVTEVHKVFDWAATSRRGVIIFIDEADAFLRRRSTEVISEEMRNALNAFLYRTGEQTDKFMVVYASNQPEQFDDAVNDRIDELVPFELPEKEERLRMLDSYMNRYLLAAPERSRFGFLGLRRSASLKVVGMDAKLMEYAATATAGFSGREISKLSIAWQAAAYGSEDCTFTPELMMEVLDAFLQQKAMKHSWDDAAAREFIGADEYEAEENSASGNSPIGTALA